MASRSESLLRGIPRNVVVLGAVSLLTDVSSELLVYVIPLFLANVLAASPSVIGLIEGIAEGVAVGLRGVAGVLSDRTRRRVPWIVAGYSLSAVARPVVAAAPAWGWVLAGRLVDRLGKAGRTAPRDALIRDSSPPGLVGASFGYHRGLDTAGAVLGPLAAALVLALGVSLRNALWLAVLPALATLALLRRVREASALDPVEATPRAAVRNLPAGFWFVLAVWIVFSLGNSSDVFLLLRSRDLGLGATLVILAYGLYNLVYSTLSWPFGALSDRVPREALLAAGLVVFVLVYLGFAVAPGSWAIWPLFAVYGVYIAATEGVARAWVADHAPAGASGTAYGVFAAATGASLLVASVVAGVLWARVGPAAPFVLGAASATAALMMLLARQLARKAAVA